MDAGDGAAEQLAKVGFSPADVTTVVLSHLHFDHTAGLFAILSLRYQAQKPAVITIYAPQDQAHGGCVRSSDGAGSESGAGIPLLPRTPPEMFVRVVEVGNGSHLNVGPIGISAFRNTHYSYPAWTEGAKLYQSLSYRFDLPNRSIVYSGDTGPSTDVTQLAHGARPLNH